MGLLIRLILRNHLARIIVGAILIIVGLVFGITSKQVSYTQSNDNTTYQIATGQQSGNVYINADGSNDYFVAFSSDFKVPQSEIDTPGSLSFIARSDTSTLDPALNTGGTTVNDAHKIEKLVLKDKSGNVIGTFTTSEYDANPNGTSVNNWPIGIGIMALGLLILILTFVFALKKKPQAFSIAPVGGVQQPYGQPHSLIHTVNHSLIHTVNHSLILMVSSLTPIVNHSLTPTPMVSHISNRLNSKC